MALLPKNYGHTHISVCNTIVNECESMNIVPHFNNLIVLLGNFRFNDTNILCACSLYNVISSSIVLLINDS